MYFSIAPGEAALIRTETRPLRAFHSREDAWVTELEANRFLVELARAGGEAQAHEPAQSHAAWTLL